VAGARGRIRDLLHGRDDRRLLAVVGPCSLHDPRAALEYADRLARLADGLRDDLVVVMRAYFEKPRTATGWKGLVNDPHLDGSGDVAAGLETARWLLARINERGLPCATEFLDPGVAPYLADLVSWGCVGARTAESQVHRQLASGLPLPVGFKNATDGRVEVARNAVLAARQPQSFVGVGADGRVAAVSTPGNPDAHVVLRGGGGRPNGSPADVERAAALLGGGAPARPVLVDAAHDNCGRDHTRQADACRSALAGLGRGAGRALLGVALESNLRPGNQPLTGGPLQYGVSVTDPCIGWEETRDLLEEVAGLVSRRSRAPRPRG
jgi:3-deoxy-7-phosphoheptulonate synthase